MWRQKSRVLWLLKIDRNTSYFHKVASRKRRANTIAPHMVGLGKNALVQDLKRKVTEFFEKHFKSSKGLHIASWDVDVPKLNREKVDCLEI